MLMLLFVNITSQSRAYFDIYKHPYHVLMHVCKQSNHVLIPMFVNIAQTHACAWERTVFSDVDSDSDCDVIGLAAAAGALRAKQTRLYAGRSFTFDEVLRVHVQDLLYMINCT